jgi:hypothetical protein
VHRSEREREDDQPREPGDQHDPETPRDADVVVHPDDHVVEDIDQRLQDVGVERHE